MMRRGEEIEAAEVLADPAVLGEPSCAVAVGALAGMQPPDAGKLLVTMFAEDAHHVGAWRLLQCFVDTHPGLSAPVTSRLLGRMVRDFPYESERLVSAIMDRAERDEASGVWPWLQQLIVEQRDAAAYAALRLLRQRRPDARWLKATRLLRAGDRTGAAKAVRPAGPA